MSRLWLTPALAQTALDALLEGLHELECSLDLGLSRQRVVLSPDGLTPAGGPVIPIGRLEEVARARRGCFLWDPAPRQGQGHAGRLEPIEGSGSYFYKLIPTDEAPTVEISGVQMHRTTGTAPFRNAVESARTVVRPGMKVLDTCGGLGYTAIAAARLGAASVVSLDIDPAVRAIARLNPWSAEYFSNPVISLVEADASEFTAAQADAAFDAVVHDPPRFSRAGQLYGSVFYGQLARVLRPRGRLFHYTGEPYSLGKGRAFVEGVVRRLRDAGFDVRREDRLQGLVARHGHVRA